MRSLRALFAALILLLLVDVRGFAAASALTVKQIDRTTSGGVDYDTYMVAADTNGNYFTNDGQTFLLVENGGVSPITLTVQWGAGTSAAVDGVAPTARTYSITNGKKRLIGPFPPLQYNDANGYVQVTYSGVTSVKASPFKLVAEKQQ